ncbi:CoA pyrophosphatase [Stappia sp. F7233]|uniref:CoA pyrophosphatase n=1 Tax=Stappia albiluteola TaxID=2758565 RepID=A0A839A9W6_9HYPH|nr:CoA pyrophosphatase [Stappia albiluteola]MBA5775727.1 CoA pyrophosphatase [Stappia albiluteola]
MTLRERHEDDRVPIAEDHGPPGKRLSVVDFRLRAEARLAAAGGREAGDHILNPGSSRFLNRKDPLKDAAVLIPIVDRGRDPTVLLTLRTEHLASHAGQVAFPGGKIDANDHGAVGAALREAHEEIGLSPHFVRTIGSLPPYLTGSGYKVVPVIGIIEAAPRLVPNPGEVADVFEVPLSFLMNPANHQRQSRVWAGERRHFYAMPYGERYIWGVTAGIIRLLYDTVYG